MSHSILHSRDATSPEEHQSSQRETGKLRERPLSRSEVLGERIIRECGSLPWQYPL